MLICCAAADIEISMGSVTGSLNIRGAHDICLLADVLFEDADFSDTEMFILPGGMPGTLTLKAHKPLGELLMSAFKSNKYVAAICAAPIVLGGLGILQGKKATCYPAADLEAQLTGAGAPAGSCCYRRQSHHKPRHGHSHRICCCTHRKA